ncbi:hypothetical protein QBE54_08240 [Thermatribacter velox]|uniref:Uncharacterized protein n=1 Tax=Thermatribacter velox TaxID=3039681 RepID=A0ABZ2Y998_9BACT
MRKWLFRARKQAKSPRVTGFCMALLLVASLSLTLGCTQGARVRPGEEFSIKVGEQVVVEGSNVRVSFQGIVEDSRCPQGMECFWEGGVIARLKIGNQEMDVEIVESQLPQEMIFGAYRMVILRILPARTSPEPPDAKEYQIFLKIELKE